MAAKRLSPAQAKAQKQKRLVIILAVVFVGVLAIQVPKLMKQMSPPPSGMRPPNPGTTAVAAAPTVVATGTTTGARTGKLANFSTLPLKDPFHALVQLPAGSPAGGAAGSPAAAAAKAAPKPKPKPAKKKTPPGPIGFTSKLPPPNAALIGMDGRKQVVFVGDPFPTWEPMFKLVAVTKKGVKIGVLGGSFTSGVPTLALAPGKRLTLANQSDGSKFVIQVVKLTYATKPAAPATPANATTPAATAPTPAATTTTTPSTTG
ncbi:MAG: hypothetical protein JO186_04215 [Actinobacteria bacterium]|nr:hypothetical protein [Actinomycetota bacterium]MBV8394635.1 hypothetical protein [Actinomycetota bacterium]